MSIFDIFTPAPSQPAPAQQAPAPQQTPVPVQPGNIPTPPAVTAEPGNPTAPVIPPVTPVAPLPDMTKAEPSLDDFKGLWDTVPTDPNNPATQQAPQALNVEDLQKTVGAIDFTQAITAEQLAAIQEGGEGATAATLQAMNAMAQKVMIQNTLVNNKLTEQAIERAVKSHSDSLPELLRSQAAADHLKTSNPIFSNPAVKPIMEATQQALLQKFPNATHAEITNMTQNYITAMGQEFAPQASVNDNTATNETDWMEFMKAPTR